MMKGQINEMFAFIAYDPEKKCEGIVAMNSLELGNLPLVGGDMERVKVLEEFVKNIVKATGTDIKLIHFQNRKEIKTYGKNSC